MFKKTTGSCLILLIVSCVTLVAQQDPQFSMNMFNTMAINPGFAGSRDMVCATALPRQQWIGFDGAPVVSSFHVHTPIRPFGISSGLGLVLLTDNIGYEKNLNLNLAYAARFDFANGKLGVGLSGGVINKGLDPKWFIPDKLGSPTTDTGIPQGKESEVALDLNFGVFYNTEEVYLGISVAHLNQPKLKYQTSTSSPVMVMHYYITAGYHIPLNNPALEFTPSVFIQSDGRSSQINLNAMMLYNKRFWGGVSYRLTDAITGMIGFELQSGLKIGYAYDFITSSIFHYSGGSHELMLGYCFSIKKERIPQRYKSIRFL